jgi:hypothetical protein
MMEKVTCLSIGPEGVAGFEDRALSFSEGNNPLEMTPLRDASGIRFAWLPGRGEMIGKAEDGNVLIAVLQGQLELVGREGLGRVFDVGEVIEIDVAATPGLVFRSPGDRACEYALIRTTDPQPGEDEKQLPDKWSPQGADYTRTIDGSGGKSETQTGSLPYVVANGTGMQTATITLSALQFVVAPATLDYSWHPAPQRQIVLFLTGGAEIENGQGERYRLLPGHIYFGEDEKGQGHITRALDGQARFSIFAHL